MEEIIPILWILLVVIVVIVAMAFQAHSAKALNETYRSVAHRFGGRSIDGGAFGRPSINFHHAGAWVRVDIYSTGGKNATYYTQVHIAWPDRATRCEVYPERFTSRVGKLLGMTDVEIGSPAFDQEFIITGNSPRSLRELLTPAVQDAIWRLRGLGRRDDIYLSIGGGKMLVKKLGLIRDARELQQFIEGALHLFDQLLAVGGEGIEIISQTVATDATEVICQICGEGIETELVHCRRCKTPHHEDCWEYFGGCSTFGCGEKRYKGQAAGGSNRMKS